MEYLESSPSSLKPSHVYISFRGDEDTRKFMHSLSAALKAEGFRIFGDDKKHENPDSNLPHHLLQAIDESWIWIVVFSKNYASSCWCLKELSQVDERIFSSQIEAQCGGLSSSVFYSAHPLYAVDAERQEMCEANIDKVNRWREALKRGFRVSGRRSVPDRVIAVYYDVDPKSFAQHIQQACTQDSFEIPQWKRKAIELVASSPGWQVRNDSGLQVIPKIVKEVKSKIDKLFYDFFGFVGIQSQVEEVEKLLDLNADDEVRVVGICGMSGLGKSSIATVLYLKVFHFFDAFCFLPNLSGRLKHGDINLQELLQRHLRTENSEMKDFLDTEFLRCKRLKKHKFLIVLDGVDLVQHLQELNLVQKSNCFGGGSRIIITTRDEQVLQKYEVKTIYRPKLLSKEEGFELLCSQAFQGGYPINEFREMIDRVLEYANGLPLAIEILGSSFFGKGIAEWRSFLDREEIIPPYKIIRVLRKSFDELDHMSKEMFLDIACFFVGKDINCVKEILHDCIDCSVDIEILIQKSVITIANERIQMHGMLQAVGRDIIQRQYPYQQSRLYLYNDIKFFMGKKRNTVMENVEAQPDGIISVGDRYPWLWMVEKVEAIALDLEEPKMASLRVDALSDMINLRLLIFHNVEFSGTLSNLSSKLRYVSWHQYPFTSLPSGFQSDTLAQLIMPESNMTEVWKGRMMLPTLRKLNLSGSKALTKTPDFGGVPNLERLELEGCTGLLQLDRSVAKLPKLRFLNLKGCINLVSIPNSMFCLNSLEVLNLAGCSKLAYCLKFSPMRSLIQVRLLSIWDNPFLENFL